MSRSLRELQQSVVAFRNKLKKKTFITCDCVPWPTDESSVQTIEVRQGRGVNGFLLNFSWNEKEQRSNIIRTGMINCSQHILASEAKPILGGLLNAVLNGPWKLLAYEFQQFVRCQSVRCPAITCPSYCPRASSVRCISPLMAYAEMTEMKSHSDDCNCAQQQAHTVDLREKTNPHLRSANAALTGERTATNHDGST